MAFLSVLKAIGRGVGFALGIVATLPQGGKPIVVVGDILSKVTQAVAMAERAAEKWGTAVTGAQKLAFAADIAADAIATSELLTGREIADQDKFQRGVNSLTSGIADILDSLKQK